MDIVYIFLMDCSIMVCGVGTRWIDCRADGNLVAAGGDDRKVRIYDARHNRTVKTFDDLHSGNLGRSSYELMILQIRFKQSVGTLMVGCWPRPPKTIA